MLRRFMLVMSVLSCLCTAHSARGQGGVKTMFDDSLEGWSAAGADESHWDGKMAITDAGAGGFTVTAPARFHGDWGCARTIEIHAIFDVDATEAPRLRVSGNGETATFTWFAVPTASSHYLRTSEGGLWSGNFDVVARNVQSMVLYLDVSSAEDEVVLLDHVLRYVGPDAHYVAPAGASGCDEPLLNEVCSVEEAFRASVGHATVYLAPGTHRVALTDHGGAITVRPSPCEEGDVVLVPEVPGTPMFTLTGANRWDHYYDFIELTFRDGTAAEGAAIDARGVALAIHRCNFTGNAATVGDGGAVHVAATDQGCAEGITTYIEACTFENNTAAGHGGAVHVETSCSVYVSGGTFTGNVAVEGDGGAISSQDCDRFAVHAMSGPVASVFRENQARNGGAISLARIGRPEVPPDSSYPLSILGAEFGHRDGSDESVNTAAGNGGHLAIEDCAARTILHGNKFTAGRAGALGGAAWITTTIDLRLAENTYTGNSAELDGGAVALMEAGTAATPVRLLGEKFGVLTDVRSGNVAGGNGGAVRAMDSHLRVQVQADVPSGDPWVFPRMDHNSANEGGALYVTGAGSTVVSQCDMQFNRAGEGGAVRVHASTGPLTISNSWLRDNVAEAAWVGEGGAISLEDFGTVELYSVLCTRNAAPDGGALHAENGEELRLDRCTLSSSVHGGGVHVKRVAVVTDSFSDMSNHRIPDATIGGALIEHVSSLSMTGTRIATNLAKRGAGLWLIDVRDVRLRSCRFIGNKASYDGGGLYADGLGAGSAEIVDSHFQMNEAVADGGGLALANPERVELRGNLIERNKAGNGGGIAITHGGLAAPGVVTLRGCADAAACALRLNTASGVGGGLYVRDAIVHVGHAVAGEFLSFSENGALVGGAVGALGTWEGAGHLADDGPMTDCPAIVSVGHLTLTNVSFQFNNAGDAGGAVAAGDKYLPGSVCEFAENQARRPEYTGIRCDIDGCDFFNNKVTNPVRQVLGVSCSPLGGGLFLSGGQTLGSTIQNSVFTSNSTTGDGGGAALQYAAQACFINTRFYSNRTSEDDGGGLHVGIRSRARLVGGLFQANVAKGGGGAIHSSCARVRAESTSFEHNEATTAQGGAIYMRNAELELVGAGTVSFNEAGRSGGGLFLWSADEPFGIEIGGCEREIERLYVDGDYTFRGNAAGVDGLGSGGAIYVRREPDSVAHPEVTISGVTINDNTADVPVHASLPVDTDGIAISGLRSPDEDAATNASLHEVLFESERDVGRDTCALCLGDVFEPGDLAKLEVSASTFTDSSRGIAGHDSNVGLLGAGPPNEFTSCIVGVQVADSASTASQPPRVRINGARLAGDTTGIHARASSTDISFSDFAAEGVAIHLDAPADARITLNDIIASSFPSHGVVVSLPAGTSVPPSVQANSNDFEGFDASPSYGMEVRIDGVNSCNLPLTPGLNARMNWWGCREQPALDCIGDVPGCSRITRWIDWLPNSPLPNRP